MRARRDWWTLKTDAEKVVEGRARLREAKRKGVRKCAACSKPLPIEVCWDTGRILWAQGKVIGWRGGGRTTTLTHSKCKAAYAATEARDTAEARNAVVLAALTSHKVTLSALRRATGLTEGGVWDVLQRLRDAGRVRWRSVKTAKGNRAYRFATV